MKSPNFWISHYITSTDPTPVQGSLKLTRIPSGADGFALRS